MGTLDEDMAQEADIAELQENFNEVVEKSIEIDHAEQENKELAKVLRRLTEELNRQRRLDSLRPRTTPKQYKF